MTTIGTTYHQKVSYYPLVNVFLKFSIGKDLVQKFLRKDPNERIDIKDILNHPWIKVRT